MAKLLLNVDLRESELLLRANLERWRVSFASHLWGDRLRGPKVNAFLRPLHKRPSSESWWQKRRRMLGSASIHAAVYLAGTAIPIVNRPDQAEDHCVAAGLFR